MWSCDIISFESLETIAMQGYFICIFHTLCACLQWYISERSINHESITIVQNKSKYN